MKQTNLALPTPKQLAAIENINRETIKFIALLNQHRATFPPETVSKLRDIHHEIGYLLNDLNTY
jgi:hypothetical protein